MTEKVKPIVLEGPDGSGKSTLGKALSESLWVDVTHDGGPSTDSEHARQRVSAFLGYSDTVRDRSTLFSDNVYKRALGQGIYLTEDEVREGVSGAAARGTLLVYCRPSLDVIIRNAEFLARAKAHKPPEYVEQVKKSLPAIVEQYDASVVKWASWGLPIVRYDYTYMKQADFVESIRNNYWENR